jgi:hypothetical protein
MSVVKYGVIIFALYPAVNCVSNKGQSSMQYLYAFCCSPFYIAYRLAVPC